MKRKRARSINRLKSVKYSPLMVEEYLNIIIENRREKFTGMEKGKPHQNGYIDRFNKTYREEVLDAFDNLRQARLLTTQNGKKLKVIYPLYESQFSNIT